MWFAIMTRSKGYEKQEFSRLRFLELDCSLTLVSSFGNEDLGVKSPTWLPGTGIQVSSPKFIFTKGENKSNQNEVYFIDLSK